MAAVDMVTEQLINMNMLTVNVSGEAAALADDETFGAARVSSRGLAGSAPPKNRLLLKIDLMYLDREFLRHLKIDLY